MGDDEEPFTSVATAALLSTHRAQVRFAASGHSSEQHTTRIAAHNSYKNIGDSSGRLQTQLVNHSGKCVVAVVFPCLVNTPAICPRPWASECAPTGGRSCSVKILGFKFPSADSHQTRFRCNSGVRAGVFW